MSKDTNDYKPTDEEMKESQFERTGIKLVFEDGNRTKIIGTETYGKIESRLNITNG